LFSIDDERFKENFVVNCDRKAGVGSFREGFSVSIFSSDVMCGFL
jgi:hypothetical protein